MVNIDAYLDLGYSGVVRETQTAGGETIVCRDRQKRCFRLFVSLAGEPGQERPKVERTELISEPRYQKIVAACGGILDDEKFMRERNQKRLSRLGAQYAQAQRPPLCPGCNRQMRPAPDRDGWICPSVPPCQARR